MTSRLTFWASRYLALVLPPGLALVPAVDERFAVVLRSVGEILNAATAVGQRRKDLEPVDAFSIREMFWRLLSMMRQKGMLFDCA